MEPLFVLGLAIGVAGLVLFGLSWRVYRTRQTIANTPTSKAATMAVGPVEIKGVAVPPPGRGLLEAPLSGTACLHWRYAIEEQRTRTVTRTHNGRTTRRTETYWARVDQGEARMAFCVRDESGHALVDPTGADLPEPEVQEFRSGAFKDPPVRLAQYLDSRGVSHEGWFGFNKTMRYREWRMPAQIPIYVLGTAVRQDATGDAPEGNAVLVVQREGRVPFLVSDKDESGLARRLGLQFGALLAGGIALATLGAWLATGGPS